MKKVWKTVGKVLLALLILLLLFILAVFILNKIKLQEEKPLLEKPLGQMVEIDRHQMCIYTEGEGKQTLVFLAGAGTASPILDFRGLYPLLSDTYQIVVVEKFGYGFSDIVETERSFDTILRQDREALKKAGISGPFILCPHSMSGLEAILWAQKYPEEVEAIIGLDMSLPKAYDVDEGIDVEKAVKGETLLAFLGREMGFARFYYTDRSLPTALSKEEKALYKAIGCKIVLNDTVIQESLAISDVVKEIGCAPKPDIPMLLFVSDGKELGIENWIGIQKDYVSDLTNAKIVALDCGHYVHYFKAEQISEEMRTFLAELNK